MTQTFDLFVPGTPAPQGSKKVVGRSKAGKVLMKESSDHVAPWRALIITMAHNELNRGQPRFDGPVRMILTYYCQRPASHYGTGRNANTIKDSAPPYPTSIRNGDLDKLQRAVFDALGQKRGAGVIRDDCDVVEVMASKVWSKGQPGCRISVRAAL